jgi:hypothetical protein
MNCEPENGVCKFCRRPISLKYPNAKRNCGSLKAEPKLPSEIQQEVEAKAEAGGMLLGDAIAALTTAVGIPPCASCKDRQAALNEWHRRARAWIASYFSPRS